MSVCSRGSRVPAVVYGYFRPLERSDHPIVVSEYGPGTIGEFRWRRTSYRKRITVSWARKLRHQGVSYVTLSDGVREADFSVGEIIRGGTA